MKWCSVRSHYTADADSDLCWMSSTCALNTSRSLTSLLLFVIGKFLDGAAMAEAADRTGQPFSQSVSRALGTRRAGLQRAEGRLRLEVRHGLGLPIRATDGIVFWKKSDSVFILVESISFWLHYSHSQWSKCFTHQRIIQHNTVEGVSLPLFLFHNVQMVPGSGLKKQDKLLHVLQVTGGTLALFFFKYTLSSCSTRFFLWFKHRLVSALCVWHIQSRQISWWGR